MNSRGRPEKLTDELKRWITLLQNKRLKRLKAPELREEIRLKLEADVEKAHKGWTKDAIRAEAEERLPGISSLQKCLKENEDRDKPSSLDRLWNVGVMSQEKYPELTAEAIEAIIRVQKWAEGKGIEEVHETVRYGITVRQALWIARLCRAVEEHIGRRPKQLWDVSWAYSAYEILCKLSGTTLDTWELDKALRKGDDKFRILIWNILAVEDDNAFKSVFQLQMASQPVPKREMRGIGELGQEAGRRAEKLRSEREQYQSKEGEK